MRALVAVAGALVVAAASGLATPTVVATQTAARGELTIDVRRRALKPGEILDVSVRTPAPLTAMAATLGGRAIPVWRVTPTAWRAIVGLDVEQPVGPIDLVVGGTPASGPPLSHTLTLAIEAAGFAERHLSVPPRFVDPPASALPRIERESKQLHAIYDTTSGDRTPGAFVAPVPHRRSSPFGSRSIFNGEPRERHGGLDFASPAGAIIRAPAAGRVALVADLYFTGNTVVIDHGQGLYSILAHMQRTLVRDGQILAQGAAVGRVGATGRATGPHLHWSVRLGGTRVDPASALDLLAPLPAR
jgi:murein DD-endopeptidase MepM/ murein hydrolase activator NlpD